MNESNVESTTCVCNCADAVCDDETNPVGYEMVQAQTVGIRVVLP